MPLLLEPNSSIRYAQHREMAISQNRPAESVEAIAAGRYSRQAHVRMRLVISAEPREAPGTRAATRRNPARGAAHRNSTPENSMQPPRPQPHNPPQSNILSSPDLCTVRKKPPFQPESEVMPGGVGWGAGQLRTSLVLLCSSGLVLSCPVWSSLGCWSSQNRP